MTDYAKQAILGSVISPLVSKEKGDFSNRANCAGAQLANNAKTLAQDVVVIGGVAAGAKAAKKGGKFAKVMAGITDKFANLCDKLYGYSTRETVERFVKTKNNKIVKAMTEDSFHHTPKFVQKLKGLSGKAKALLPLIALGGLAISYITSKHLYKKGQIDQKYTDKAKVEQRQKETLD